MYKEFYFHFVRWYSNFFEQIVQLGSFFVMYHFLAMSSHFTTMQDHWFISALAIVGDN